MNFASPAAPVVNATDVRKRFGKKTALDGLTLALPAQRVTAVLGENGAGKTTLIRSILGLTPITSGSLEVFGMPPGSALSRSRTGVMLQDADLPDLLTAREHLVLFASYYDNPLDVDSALEACGIADLADKRYKVLSGGQKRRVQFALAVIGQPDLLFLDEPTTGLDADARRRLWALVRQLADRGTTIVLTTHYLEEADALADDIVLLKDGRAIRQAATAEIRSAVGGALVRCVSTVTTQRARQFGGVRAARAQGRFLELLTSDAPATLRDLLAADPSPADLTVTKPSLEDAVADLGDAGNANVAS